MVGIEADLLSLPANPDTNVSPFSEASSLKLRSMFESLFRKFEEFEKLMPVFVGRTSVYFVKDLQDHLKRMFPDVGFSKSDFLKLCWAAPRLLGCQQSATHTADVRVKQLNHFSEYVAYIDRVPEEAREERLAVLRSILFRLQNTVEEAGIADDHLPCFVPVAVTNDRRSRSPVVTSRARCSSELSGVRSLQEKSPFNPFAAPSSPVRSPSPFRGGRAEGSAMRRPVSPIRLDGERRPFSSAVSPFSRWPNERVSSPQRSRLSCPTGVKSPLKMDKAGVGPKRKLDDINEDEDGMPKRPRQCQSPLSPFMRRGSGLLSSSSPGLIGSSGRMVVKESNRTPTVAEQVEFRQRYCGSPGITPLRFARREQEATVRGGKVEDEVEVLEFTPREEDEDEEEESVEGEEKKALVTRDTTKQGRDEEDEENKDEGDIVEPTQKTTQKMFNQLRLNIYGRKLRKALNSTFYSFLNNIPDVYPSCTDICTLHETFKCNILQLFQKYLLTLWKLKVNKWTEEDEQRVRNEGVFGDSVKLITPGMYILYYRTSGQATREQIDKTLKDYLSVFHSAAQYWENLRTIAKIIMQMNSEGVAKLTQLAVLAKRIAVDMKGSGMTEQEVREGIRGIANLFDHKLIRLFTPTAGLTVQNVEFNRMFDIKLVDDAIDQRVGVISRDERVFNQQREQVEEIGEDVRAAMEFALAEGGDDHSTEEKITERENKLLRNY